MVASGAGGTGKGNEDVGVISEEGRLGGERDGVWEVRDEDVEQERSEDRALRDAQLERKGVRGGGGGDFGVGLSVGQKVLEPVVDTTSDPEA